jgi:hypothetical protein
MNPRAAEATMRKLVSRCGAVSGELHFRVTLMPSGKIEFGAPAGDTKEGVVPTCVLTRGLTHNVALKDPCTFDVRLEKTPGAAPSSSAAPASSRARP